MQQIGNLRILAQPRRDGLDRIPFRIIFPPRRDGVAVRRLAAFRDIVAGAKPAAGAADQDDPHCGVAGRVAQGIEEQAMHLGGEGIETLRPVHRDGEDARP